MNLEQILNYRRSVRYYSDTKLIDTEKVAHCLRLAQLAPTSSNMQLYEMYHITDKDVLKNWPQRVWSRIRQIQRRRWWFS